MALPIARSGALIPPLAPRLPSPTVEYDQQYMAQLINVLRLYFNTIDNFDSALASNTGGSILRFPYGAFQDTTTQTAAAATPTAITLNQTDLSNGVTIGTPTSRILVNAAGIYNLQFSVQASNSSAQIDDVTVWIRLNGVDIPNSAGLVGVPNKHGSVNGHIIIAWNFMATMNAGDYYEMYWTTDNGSSSLVAFPASLVAPVHPAAPSVILTMQYVSALTI